MTPHPVSEFHPINDVVVYRAIRRDRKTASGIVASLYDAGHGYFDIGEVLAVGPGRPLPEGGRAEMRLKPGDFVIMPWRKGKQYYELDGGGDEVRVCREGDVDAVIGEELIDSITGW
jgi:co-chaperonin GroES (HSP10)